MIQVQTSGDCNNQFLNSFTEICKVNLAKKFYIDSYAFEGTDEFGVIGNNYKYNLILDDISRRMIYSIRRAVYSNVFETQKKIVFQEYPMTWFQHFKRDCLPKWLIRLFPVKYTKVEKEVEFIREVEYPMLPLGEVNDLYFIKEKINVNEKNSK